MVVLPLAPRREASLPHQYNEPTISLPSLFVDDAATREATNRLVEQFNRDHANTDDDSKIQGVLAILSDLKEIADQDASITNTDEWVYKVFCSQILDEIQLDQETERDAEKKKALKTSVDELSRAAEEVLAAPPAEPQRRLQALPPSTAEQPLMDEKSLSKSVKKSLSERTKGLAEKILEACQGGEFSYWKLVPVIKDLLVIFISLPQITHLTLEQKEKLASAVIVTILEAVVTATLPGFAVWINPAISFLVPYIVKGLVIAGIFTKKFIEAEYRQIRDDLAYDRLHGCCASCRGRSCSCDGGVIKCGCKNCTLCVIL